MKFNPKIKGSVKITVFSLLFAESHLALFKASFETNPLDGKCDQRAEVSSQPVQVIYDAVSINVHLFIASIHLTIHSLKLLSWYINFFFMVIKHAYHCIGRLIVDKRTKRTDKEG